MFIENGTTKCLKAPEGRHVYRKGQPNVLKPRGDMFIENGTTKRLKAPAPEGRHVYRKRDNQTS